MMKKRSTLALKVALFAVFLGAFGWLGHMDYEDEVAQVSCDYIDAERASACKAIRGL